MLASSLMIGLLAGPALAEEPSGTVFVSRFQATSDEAAGLAGLLGSFLEAELAAHESLQPVNASGAPDFGEHSAEVYLDSCPPGEVVGCAWIVADAMNAPFAITGLVDALPEGAMVKLSIIDVGAAREAITLELELGVGDDERFAAGVADLIVAVVYGEMGGEADIRETGEQQEVVVTGGAINDAVVAAQLEQLAREMGDISAVGSRSDRKIDQPRYTLEDLEEDLDSDAAKPWELANMSSSEYLRYKNSGMSMMQWRQASLGRQGQILIRPLFGATRGAVDTRYEARYAEELLNDGYVVVDRYAWQAAENATGITAGGWVGYGITPSLEVTGGAGVLTGRYTLRVNREEVGEPLEEDRNDGETVGQVHVWGGARVAFIAMPTWRARPGVAAGVVYRAGHVYSDFWQPSEDRYPVLGRQWTVDVQAAPMGELTVTENVDITLMLPLGFTLAGRTSETFSTEGGVIQAKDPAPSVSGFSAGLELGVTVRLFGAEPERGPAIY